MFLWFCHCFVTTSSYIQCLQKHFYFCIENTKRNTKKKKLLSQEQQITEHNLWKVQIYFVIVVYMKQVHKMFNDRETRLKNKNVLTLIEHSVPSINQFNNWIWYQMLRDKNIYLLDISVAPHSIAYVKRWNIALIYDYFIR